MARRTREQWQGLFQAQIESGLSATEFCRRRDIDPNYFFQRKGKLGRRPEASDEKAAGFVELRPPLPVAGALELHFSGVSLSLPANASPGWVATLMRELAGAIV
jgi:hypothetical protein